MKTPIHLFNMFALNYPHNFVETVWQDRDQYIMEHLQTKFELAYQDAGPYGALTCFWSRLDDNNRAILENWILTNYKG